MDNWDRILCFFGLHKPDNKWIRRAYANSEHCACERCGDLIDRTTLNRRSG